MYLWVRKIIGPNENEEENNKNQVIVCEKTENRSKSNGAGSIALTELNKQKTKGVFTAI